MTGLSHHESDEPGWEVLHAAVAAADERLGQRLTAAYAIGSLGHGGFSRYASDVDLALLIDDDEPADRIVAEVTREVASQNPLSQRLSMFHVPHRRFSDPPPGARFPAIDRLDLVESGVLVQGRAITSGLPRPSRETVASEAVIFTAQRTNIEDLAVEGDVRSVTKTVMAPLRLITLVETGEVTSNEVAARRYRGRHPELIDEAMRSRHSGSSLAVDLASVHDLYLEQFERIRALDDVPDAHLLDPIIAELSQAVSASA